LNPPQTIRGTIGELPNVGKSIKDRIRFMPSIRVEIAREPTCYQVSLVDAVDQSECRMFRNLNEVLVIARLQKLRDHTDDESQKIISNIKPLLPYIQWYEVDEATYEYVMYGDDDED
jgi:hypothetical protein